MFVMKLLFGLHGNTIHEIGTVCYFHKWWSGASQIMFIVFLVPSGAISDYLEPAGTNWSDLELSGAIWCKVSGHIKRRVRIKHTVLQMLGIPFLENRKVSKLPYHVF